MKAKMLRIHVILGTFWQDGNTPEDLRSLELSDWMDVLAGISADELRKAWAGYQTSGPRSQTGRLARPDAGAIYTRVIAARVMAAIINPPPRVRLAAPPPAPRMTPERMAEIMAETGYKGMPVAKPFPSDSDRHE